MDSKKNLPKKKTLGKQALIGVFVAGWIAGLLYLGFIYHFFELDLRCSLRRADARIQAKEIRLAADFRAKEIVLEAERKAQHALVISRGRWVNQLEQARDQGVIEYGSVFWQYLRDARETKAWYDKKLAEAKAQAEKIRQEQYRLADRILKTAGDETNPLALLLESKSANRSIEGYLYDPANGDVMPRTELDPKASRGE